MKLEQIGVNPAYDALHERILLKHLFVCEQERKLFANGFVCTED